MRLYPARIYRNFFYFRVQFVSSNSNASLFLFTRLCGKFHFYIFRRFNRRTKLKSPRALPWLPKHATPKPVHKKCLLSEFITRNLRKSTTRSINRKRGAQESIDELRNSTKRRSTGAREAKNVKNVRATDSETFEWVDRLSAPRRLSSGAKLNLVYSNRT